MRITSAQFIKSVVGEDPIFTNDRPKIVFVGRSNVGKSSLINALTQSNISRTSSLPGSTQAINIFLINNQFYLIDLPGYGFVESSLRSRKRMGNLIASYLFDPSYIQQKVVLIVDAVVGMTERDLGMLDELRAFPKDFIVAASKIDKLKPSEYHKKIADIQKSAGDHPVFPFSSTEKKGLDEIANAVFV